MWTCPLCPGSVPRVEDQPHAEVGGRVAGAGLSGPDCLLRRQRGERTLPQVVTISTLSLG